MPVPIGIGPFGCDDSIILTVAFKSLQMVLKSVFFFVLSLPVLLALNWLKSSFFVFEIFRNHSLKVWFHGAVFSGLRFLLLCFQENAPSSILAF